MSNLKYVVLHNHPDGLVMNDLQRDLLFATGNVLAVKECCLYSLQPEFFKDIKHRPLAIVLWGMADRYGVAEDLGIQTFEAISWGEAHSYCLNLRLSLEQCEDESGNPDCHVRWEKID